MPSDQPLRVLKKIDLEVPVSMLVAFPKRFVVYLCLKCGFDDFICMMVPFAKVHIIYLLTG